MALLLNVALATSMALAVQAQAPAAPQTTTTLPPVSVSAQQPTPTDPGARLVCQTQSVVGSNRRQRVCMTVAERDERRRSSASERERLDRLADPTAAGNGQGAQMTGRGF